MRERLELIGPWFWSKKKKKFVDWKIIKKEKEDEENKKKIVDKVS